ncbi:hypothetical protein AAF712_016347, partial [Marasmius tenuissimus]
MVSSRAAYVPLVLIVAGEAVGSSWKLNLAADFDRPYHPWIIAHTALSYTTRPLNNSLQTRADPPVIQPGVLDQLGAKAPECKSTCDDNFANFE